MASVLFLWILFGAEIQLGDKILDVEIADTVETRAKGLMFREELCEDCGMLFVYETPQVLSFWMKNTRIPLSIGFFDEKQILLQVLDMEVAKTEPLPFYKSHKKAQYALEVNRGWFEQNGIELGEKFSFR